MIHAHMKSTLQEDDEAVDEIGEKHITSRKNFKDASPPTIFMMEKAKFNKSSPIKDLSFFESDLMTNQDIEQQNGKSI